MMAARSGNRRRPKIDAADLSAFILSILEQADRPLTAYGIQAQAAATGVQLYPTQIYRTVRRLIEETRVTRIETANAYVASKSTAAALALCRSCGRVFPFPIGGALEACIAKLETSGFVMDNLVIEAVGECHDCAAK